MGEGPNALLRDERLENLGRGVRAIVSDEHSFGADAVLLEHFTAPRRGERLCDLGTGCGIIPLLWCRTGPYAIDAFELQPRACDQARRAAALNGFGFRVIEADLRAIGSAYNGLYDAVACNPPYLRAGGGRASARPARAVARQELCCTLADVVGAAAKLLKPGGRLCLCHRPQRLAELLTLLSQAGVEPKRLRMVQQTSSAKPWLVLAEGRRGAKPGLEVLPVLLCEEDGGVSREMREIYGDYYGSPEKERKN